MWSLFSRDPAKDFAYEIGEKVSGLEDKSIWSLHQGKRKNTGEEVSVFAFDVKNSSESQVAVAKSAFKRIKTLRHPNILSYLDGLESEKVLYVVTEPVVPLEIYIRNNEQKSGQNNLAISWGLHQVAKGLSFLNNDCNLIHNNVCLTSVFVDKAGEWHLGGVDYMYPASGADCLPPVKILPALEKYDPPEKTGGGGRFKPTEKWSSDMWGLGCLIWEVFNGNLPKTASLKTLGKIPKNLVPHYCELVGANPKSRPNPAKFIENSRARGGFLDNKFVQTMLFLEEIQIKENNEKSHFFNSLSPVLDTFPESFCKHKILPQLIHAFEYGNAGSAILQPLFKLGSLLDTVEYQKKVVPCVVKLFSSTDRSTRVKLLQQIELFVVHLTPDIVNTKIFPNICQGFMDTNPVVREHTIKSMLHLAEKLNYKNLNEELLKHFARLQTKDDQGGIRTNTTVCLGKIAGHLNPQMRQKVLCSAYLRALKDPFPPARQAGVVAMAATHNFFTLKESANRLLPAVCSMTLDPEKIVRDQAFKAIRCFMGKLEKVSENPELVTEMEKDVLTGGSAASSAAGWAGWAVSGMSSITSKIYKGKGKPTASPTKQQNVAASPAAVETKASNGIRSSPEPAAPVPSTPAPSTFPDTVLPSDGDEEEQEEGWNENEGWDDDDDWGDMDETSTGGSGSGTMAAAAAAAAGSSPGDGWDNDDWGSLENTSPAQMQEPAGEALSMAVKKDPSPWGSADFVPVDDKSNAASSFNWGNESNNDFFSSMITDDKKPNRSSRPSSGTSLGSRMSAKPNNPLAFGATSKTDTAVRDPFSSRSSQSGTSAGWDGSGWGGADEWGADSSQGGQNKADLAKKQREERRAQQRREMEEKRAARQGGGALRLGSRKLASD